MAKAVEIEKSDLITLSLDEWRFYNGVRSKGCNLDHRASYSLRGDDGSLRR